MEETTTNYENVLKGNFANTEPNYEIVVKGN